MRKALLVLACAGLLLLSRPAWAWHGAGHAAVAAIACEDLKDSPGVRDKIRQVLQQHSDRPEWERFRPAEMDEGLFLLMAASLWPDDIRSPEHPSHFFHSPSWHYKDLPIYVSAKRRPVPYHAEDAIKALRQVQTTLRGSGPGRVEQRSAALCWLAHLVGDIHQPLHAATLVSDDFPLGDGGGNLFWVLPPNSDEPVTLHSFWDGLFDKQADFSTFPRDAEGRPDGTAKAADMKRAYQGAVALAQQIVMKHSRASHPAALLDTGENFSRQSRWLQESHDLAAGFAYGQAQYRLAPGIKDANDPERERFLRNPVQLGEDFETMARTLCERQISLAGYRLAQGLRRLYG